MTTTRMFNVFNHNIPQHGCHIPSVYYIPSQRTSTWPRHIECLLYSIPRYLNMAATYRGFTIFNHNVPQHRSDISRVYSIQSQRISTSQRHIEDLLYSITTCHNITAAYRGFTLFNHNVPQHRSDTSRVYSIQSQRISTSQRHIEGLLYSITTYINIAATHRGFTIFYHNVPQHRSGISRVYSILSKINVTQHRSGISRVYSIQSQRTSTSQRHIDGLLYSITTYLNIAATHRGFTIFYHNVPQHPSGISRVYSILSQRNSTSQRHIEDLLYSITTCHNIAATHRGFTLFNHNVPQHRSDISRVYFIKSQRNSTSQRHIEDLLYSITTCHNIAATHRGFTIFNHNVPQHHSDISRVYSIKSQRTSTWQRHIEGLLYSITTYLNIAATNRGFTLFNHNVPQHRSDTSRVYSIQS